MKITPTGIFAIANATICGTLIKLHLVDHTSLKVLAISAPVSFILINFGFWYGIRAKATRQARMKGQD